MKYILQITRICDGSHDSSLLNSECVTVGIQYNKEKDLSKRNINFKQILTLSKHFQNFRDKKENLMLELVMP